MPVTDVEAEAQRVAEELEGQDFDGLVVSEASVEIRPDSSGERSAFFEVTLPDPAGEDTWPLEQLLALRRRLTEAGRELGVPVYLWILSVSDPPQDDEQM